MNTYLALKIKHQKEIEDFPIFFAFTDQQFEQGMKKLGLDPGNTNAICWLRSIDGFCRREDVKKLYDMFDRQAKEMQDAIDNDTTGDGFVFDMFNYELGNHEYVVTHDVSEALDALNLSIYIVNNNKKLLNGLNKAIEAQWTQYEKNN